MSNNDYVSTPTPNNEKTKDHPTHLKISISKGYKTLLIRSSASTSDCSPSDNLNPNNVSLQSAYNRMIRIRNAFMRLDLMARKNDITLNHLKWGIISNGSNTTDLTRDVTEFLEVLNQKQIHKIKRKRYIMEKKNSGCKAKDMTPANLMKCNKCGKINKQTT